MIGPQVQISSWYRSYTPLSLRGECLGFIVGRCGHDDLITVDVGGSGGGSCKLRLFFGLLLYLSDLLPLLRGCWDLHTQNDVSDLRLGQGSYIHAREETETLLLDRRRVRLVFKAKGTLNVSCVKIQVESSQLTCSFCHNRPGWDLSAQPIQQKRQGKKTIHKAKKQLPNKKLKMDTEKSSELVNYSNTWEKQRRWLTRF